MPFAVTTPFYAAECREIAATTCAILSRYTGLIGAGHVFSQFMKQKRGVGTMMRPHIAGLPANNHQEIAGARGLWFASILAPTAFAAGPTGSLRRSWPSR